MNASVNGTESDVLVDRRGQVMIITINRPDAMNAVNGSVATQVDEAVQELEHSSEMRVGILTGAGGTFCSGLDLKAYGAGDPLPEVGDRGLCGIQKATLRKPLIAAVEGWALAGGFELLMGCDIVVASRKARFGVPEVKHSLVAGGGAALLLPHRIPRAIAMDLLLTGDTIDAQRAYDAGIVSRLADEGQALEDALGVAAKIAANGPLAVEATKKIALGMAQEVRMDDWRWQDDIWGPVFESEDSKEGVRAFAEKRRATFKGV